MIRAFLLVLLLLVPSLATVRAQAPDAASVIRQARAHVQALTAAEMYGRGYLYDGHTKAAVYIRHQFREMGLSPVDGSYMQDFMLDAEVFPAVPHLQVDGRSLAVGTEFLPAAVGISGSSRASLPVVADTALGQSRASGRVILLGRRSREALVEAAAAGARAAIVLVDHLYLAPRPSVVSIPVFYVHREAWPPDAETVRYSMQRRQVPVRTQNVMARIEGTTQPDSMLLLMAHYDHVGSLGKKIYFPGANDNASGVAMLLALARHWARHPPAYSIVFVAFSGEEEGLVGSRYFAEHPPIDLRRVAFLMNFDMVASGEDGITALGGVPFAAAYSQLRGINDRLDLGPLGKRPIAPNSDHYYFMRAGVPGFFLYTKDGTQPYHHVRDVPATLDWQDFWHVYTLSLRFLEALQAR